VVIWETGRDGQRNRNCHVQDQANSLTSAPRHCEPKTVNMGALACFKCTFVQLTLCKANFARCARPSTLGRESLPKSLVCLKRA
jgi:hypothetical protein